MAVDSQLQKVLRLYPDDCQGRSGEMVASPDSFSGAGLWRVETARGPLCLRRWPPEHPTPERLEFIQAVLWHVEQEGFRLAPLPLETNHHHGYVRHAGHLWELTPWLSGIADFDSHLSPGRLEAALVALARFHQAARSFPLPEVGPTRSPGLVERRDRLRLLMTSRTAELGAAITDAVWPELAVPARRLMSLFEITAPKLLPLLEQAAALRIHLQPCIRDIWRAHVLFVEQQVSGIVDFGSMRPDNIAADLARLLGSFMGDDPQGWKRGLEAYQSIRLISADEQALISAFDRSTVLMGGIQWLEWIYLERRRFANRVAVMSRVQEFLPRLTRLSETLS